MLDPRREDTVDRLRALLEAHRYAGPEATAALGAPIGSEHRPDDLPLYLRRLASPRPLHTLIKLFGLHAAVPEAEARSALAPLSIEELAALGLVERAGSHVRPLVALAVVEGLVLARDRPDPVTFAVQPDHVLGVSPPALLLAHLTVRRAGGARPRHRLRRGRAGAPRRAPRGECRGDGPQPARAGLRPLQRPPQRSPQRRVARGRPLLPRGRRAFRPRGVEPAVRRLAGVVAPLPRRRGAGDGICARIVAGLGSHLAEGGFATVLANWALGEGEDWSLRPRRWVEGTGCDAWILRSETQDALTYAAVWTRGPEASGYEDALERWRAHYEALGIRSLVMGALVLRKRSAGPAWVRADELPATPDRDTSAALERVFAGEDRLRELATNASLLEEVLRVAGPLRLRQTVAFRDGAARGAGGRAQPGGRAPAARGRRRRDDPPRPAVRRPATAAGGRGGDGPLGRDRRGLADRAHAGRRPPPRRARVPRARGALRPLGPPSPMWTSQMTSASLAP